MVAQKNSEPIQQLAGKGGRGGRVREGGVPEAMLSSCLLVSRENTPVLGGLNGVRRWSAVVDKICRI